MSQRWPVKVPADDTVPVIDWVTPQLNERTSISFLCLLSLDSPSSPSTFRNTSDGIALILSVWELVGSEFVSCSESKPHACAQPMVRLDGTSSGPRPSPHLCCSPGRASWSVSRSRGNEAADEERTARSEPRVASAEALVAAG